MQHIAKILLVLLLVITMSATAASNRRNVMIYFNGGCSSCVQYVERLEHALQSAGIIDIVRCDYYANRSALDALSDLREKLNVPQEFAGSVTTIVDGKYVFVGFFPIDVMISFVGSNPSFDRLITAEGLKPDTYRIIKDGIAIECDSHQKIADCLYSGSLSSTLGVWTIVLVSGLMNGLNPCAIAVLAYFIGAVSVHRSKREILRIGTFYVLSIYVVYFAIGAGLTRAILSSGLVQAISKALGVFVIAASVLDLQNALRRESKFPVKIPRRLFLPIARRFSYSWIQKSAIIAALLFGGVVAALEFSCTGGVYAAIVGMLSLRTDSILILYLLGYNFMFVMPLIILLFLSCSILNFPSTIEMLRTHRYLSRSMSALLTLGLGTLLLLS